ncbi:MAG TPA: LptF/LptG family permease [Vicinamibacterales bacterium]|nr:LptF/LptG family permease [Vicinamibacterales bacterium]
MFKTLDRYVIREILPPFFLSLLIFTFILEIPPTMDYLEALVAKGVTWSVAARIVLTLVPQALGLTIPMALLVGLLIGLGRMSGDREAVALLACGVSPYRLLRPVFLFAAVIGAAHLYVMIRAIPDANQTYRQIVYDVVSQQVENDVRPQVFFTNFPNWVLYARDIPKAGGGWKDVMVAETGRPDGMTVLYLAARGRLVLDRQKQTVTLVLEDGTRYSRRGDRAQSMETYRFPTDLMVQLDPKTVFSDSGKLLRGLNELTITALQEQARDKLSKNTTAHQEMMAIQQKFSFPAACVVFGIIGVALGLTVARDGKLAGFVVGIAVIFVYYILLYLAESVTKGYYAGPDAASRTLLVGQLARWVPNLILLPFGILALIWRARWAEGRIPFRSIVKLTNAVKGSIARRRAAASSASAPSPAAAPGAPAMARRRGVVVVIRVPRIAWLMPTILDRYVAGIYVRAVALSFAALLGLFYIGTFIDKTDKLFKGQATPGMVVQLLGYMTPQFVYFVIPLAALLGVLVTFGLLSRSSELAVMKACGISLYRIAAPLLVLSLAWSAVLYGLEQRVMAQANEKAEALDSRIRGRQPRTSNPLLRQWVVGRDGAIYHYTYFDPQRRSLQNLEVYRPARDAWRLDSQLFARSATFKGDTWLATTGWQQDFTGQTAWTAFAERPLPLEPPDYFETLQPIAEMMTVPQLKRYIDELSASGFNVVPLTIDLQKKLAFPFVTVVMTLLAIPFGMTAGKRGTLYGIGIGIVLALVYWILGGAFAAVGKAGILGPIMAGWAPNILAAGSAAYLLLTART